MHRDGASINEMMEKFGRNEGSIKSRILKLEASSASQIRTDNLTLSENKERSNSKSVIEKLKGFFKKRWRYSSLIKIWTWVVLVFFDIFTTLPALPACCWLPSAWCATSRNPNPRCPLIPAWAAWAACTKPLARREHNNIKGASTRVLLFFISQ